MADEQNGKTALELAREKAEAEAAEVNKGRSGVGTRVQVGATRGKNTQIISYEQFDFGQPETLPKSVSQFMETVSNDETVLTDYLIRGFNAASYEAASDPLAEHVANSWTDEVKLTFRTAVRNYSRGLGISLDDAVAVIRPGFVAKFGE